MKYSDMMGVEIEGMQLLQDFLEDESLKLWQKHFCGVAHVFIQCLDNKGNALTDICGKESELEIVKEAIDKELLYDLLQRVSESELEDQAVETTAYPNFKMGMVCTRIQGKPILNWLVCGVIEDADEASDFENPPLSGITSLSMEQYYHALDALRDLTETILQYKWSMLNANAESRRSKSSEMEMGAVLKRTEALTDIVSLLESEDAIEIVMNRLLHTVCEFLDISGGMIYRNAKTQDPAIEVMSSWARNLQDQVDSRVLINKYPTVLTPDRNLVFSYSNVSKAEEKQAMEAMNVKALVIVPIMVNGRPSMYVAFGQRERDKNWKLEEIKFINDSVKILQNILTRRIQKNSLASSFASLETILNHVGSCVYVRDLNTGRILFANGNMRNTFQKELETNRIYELFEQNHADEGGALEVHYPEKNAWYDLYYKKIDWVDGRPVLLNAVYDITQKKEYQERIERQAYTDFLTGMYNRMCCERDLAKFVDQAKKEGRNGGILYIDLDNFKHINDGLGHQYGDVLLKSISHALLNVKGIENTCYRMGGDEFVLIVPPDHFDCFEAITASVKDIFAQPWYLKDGDYYCTMSMGVVEFPESGEDVHDLIKKADIAMYSAKKGGKNRSAKYTATEGETSGRQLDIEKNMRYATANGCKEFEVYYQPIIDIRKKGNPCTGAEALIRWNSSTMGFMSPGDFIPLAEYLGLINPIGNYVLYEACRTCRSWNDNGYPGYKVNVNLSVVQLLQKDILDIIKQTIKDTGINPKNLTLEVTESLAINDMDRMQKILGEIKALGIRIALDDFGTGYSSLNHVRKLPMDVIKVDQSFTKGLGQDPYAVSFIHMVGDLAGAIGVNVCVEGVETKEQIDLLTNQNIDLIQGYYFDKPMTRGDFEAKYLPEFSF